MIYIYDSNVFSQIFRSYYRSVFPSLWSNFDALVSDGRILSTDEVRRELEDRLTPDLETWLSANIQLFPPTSTSEARFIRNLVRDRHFQQIVEDKKIRYGGKNADLYVVAKASVLDATVVTQEKGSSHGARIPDVCRRFSIPCINLQQFMEAENWEF